MGIISSVNDQLQGMGTEVTKLNLSADTATAGTGMYADLTDTVAVDLNQMRVAAAIQRFKELSVHGFWTYTE